MGRTFKQMMICALILCLGLFLTGCGNATTSNSPDPAKATTESQKVPSQEPAKQPSAGTPPQASDPGTDSKTPATGTNSNSSGSAPMVEEEDCGC